MAHQTRARAAKLQKPEPKYVFTNVTTGELEPSNVTKALTADWDKHFKEMFGVSKNHVKFTATAWRHLGISSLRDAGITRQEQQALVKHMAHNLSTADRKNDDSKQTEMRRDCLEKAVELTGEAAAKSSEFGESHSKESAESSAIVAWICLT